MFAVFGTAVAGAMVSGCGDDTGSGTTPEDAQADGASQPDTGVPDVAAEAAPQDATLDTGHPDASPDVTVSDASPDVAQDASHPDGSSLDATADAQVDARPDASDAGARDAADAGTPDSSDAASPGDGGDGGDAGDGAVACVTTIGSLDDSGPGQLLFGFDTQAEASAWTQYTFPTTSSSFVFTQSPTEGPAGFGCPGAMSLAVTYTGYGVQSGVDYNFPTAQDWTGRVRLHMWIKVVTSDYTTINGVEEIVFSQNLASDTPTTYIDDFGGFLAGSGYASGGWLELVTDISTPTASYFPTTVVGLEVRLTTVNSMADGGPAVPPPATLLVDDIWVE
ncbi:MAG TPA: hypothetical protein VGM06_06605 [Polyangiaceae bacterium]